MKVSSRGDTVVINVGPGDLPLTHPQMIESAKKREGVDTLSIRYTGKFDSALTESLESNVDYAVKKILENNPNIVLLRIPAVRAEILLQTLKILLETQIKYLMLHAFKSYEAASKAINFLLTLPDGSTAIKELTFVNIRGRNDPFGVQMKEVLKGYIDEEHPGQEKCVITFEDVRRKNKRIKGDASNSKHVAEAEAEAAAEEEAAEEEAAEVLSVLSNSPQPSSGDNQENKRPKGNISEEGEHPIHWQFYQCNQDDNGQVMNHKKARLLK